MEKKDEKTFADLFSSSENAKKQEEQKNEVDRKKDITFDNLFDNLSSTDSAKDFSILEENNSNNNISLSQKSELNMNSIFGEFKEKSEKNNQIFQKDESHNNENDKSISSFFTQNLEISDSSILKSEENNINEKNLFFSKETEKEEMIPQETLKNEEQKQDINNNLIFDNDTLTTEDEISDNEIDSTSEVKENLFFSNETEKEEMMPQENLKNEEQKQDINNNLIFDNDTSTTEDEISDNEIDSTSEVKENLFFSNETEISPRDDFKTDDGGSPFFQDEINKENDNPFFENKINLIENTQHSIDNNKNIDITKTKNFKVHIVKKKEPLIKVILGVLSYALFIWLLLIGITLLIYILDIKIRASKGDYSSPTFNAYVVLTGSMLPEIKVYDVVITKKVDAAKLQEGDVITFASADSRFEGTIITHRIIKKNPSTNNEGYTFQTRGDNNNVADSALVPEANIYGKVILKIPKLGYLQEFLAKDGGWIIVILIPCLVVISYDVVKLGKGLKKRKYKNIKVQK